MVPENTLVQRVWFFLGSAHKLQSAGYLSDTFLAMCFRIMKDAIWLTNVTVLRLFIFLNPQDVVLSISALSAYRSGCSCRSGYCPKASSRCLHDDLPAQGPDVSEGSHGDAVHRHFHALRCSFFFVKVFGCFWQSWVLESFIRRVRVLASSLSVHFSLLALQKNNLQKTHFYENGVRSGAEITDYIETKFGRSASVTATL